MTPEEVEKYVTIIIALLTGLGLPQVRKAWIEKKKLAQQREYDKEDKELSKIEELEELIKSKDIIIRELELKNFKKDAIIMKKHTALELVSEWMNKDGGDFISKIKKMAEEDTNQDD